MSKVYEAFKARVKETLGLSEGHWMAWAYGEGSAESVQTADAAFVKWADSVGISNEEANRIIEARECMDTLQGFFDAEDAA